MPRLRLALPVVSAALSAIAVLPATSALAMPLTEGGMTNAYYSARAEVPQAKSVAAMRTYLSTDQARYTQQSFVWAGPLIEDNGNVNSVAIELERDDTAIKGFMLPVFSAGALYNDADDPGYRVGGLGGIPEVTFPLSFTRYPWSLRATQQQLFEQPQFVDARAVKGEVGAKGTVYELTAHANNIATYTPSDDTLDIYVRVKDRTGLVQWGYGPSGFIPMWLRPDQRAAINARFHGSVLDYLTATDDSMWDQGEYYYSMPLLQVQKFVVQERGHVVSRGHGGWIWCDSVVRSWDAASDAVTTGGGGIGWLEFSVQIPGTREALKIGYTKSKTDIGRYPYAILVGPGSPKARNGSYTSLMNWGLQDIHFTPVRSSKWTNPHTHNSYYTKWKVDLDKSARGSAVHLTVTQAVPDQEASISGRNVFEGAFRVKGSIGSRHVDGWAFGEIQQPGQGS